MTGVREKFAGENASRDEPVTPPCGFSSTKSKTEPKPSLVMKPIIPFALLGALFAVGAANAQSSTTPVGYVTQQLNANSFNLLGLTLQTPVAVSGDFEAVAGATLTDSDVADFAAVLPAGRTYILEVTSGGSVGVTQDFVTVSGSTITLPTAITVAADDTYRIRVAPTLEEVFGTTTSVLTKGFNAGAADNIWIPTGGGNYARYFLHTSNVWRNSATSADSPNVPLVYLDGALIEKKGAAASLTVTGEVKTNATNVVVETGFNVLSVMYPASSTLQNLGLEDDLTAGFNAGAADNVWVPGAGGTYTRYFRHTSGVWRNSATSADVLTDVELPSAIWIERKGAAATLDLTPPTSYASL